MFLIIMLELLFIKSKCLKRYELYTLCKVIDFNRLKIIKKEKENNAI